ncbi:MAG TPA: thiamine pyrophosphate-dependent enzyme, partial [Ktedonobacterales bacterium]|nr:thiamine pyrophosphate-dependent enzyme [Ktedonobacterales bacterium]
MGKTASDTLVERLIAWGVDTVFGLPGDGINGMIEAFREQQDKVRFIQVRHEEAAAFAACAYAKFTGRLGVCVATSGPGAIHLLNGLYDAKMDGAPVLAITGQQYSDLLGSHYQQEVNLLSLFEDVTAYNMQVQGPNDVYNLVNTACRVALSQRAVAHITFPIDYQVTAATMELNEEPGGPAMTPNQVTEFQPGFYAAGVDGHSGAALQRPASPIPGAVPLQQAADILNRGGKVAILAGHGAIHATDLLEKLADTLAAPIVKPLLGKGAVPDDSPFTTGGLGLLGTAPSEDVMEQCDTLLIIGSSYPYPAYLPKPGQAHGVQIDIDPTRIGLRYPVEVGLVGDALATLEALLPLLQHKSDRAFLEMAQKGMQAWNQKMELEGTREDKPMKPQVVAHTLEKLAAPNAIITGDSGTNTTWIARNFRLKRDQMYSCSGNLATMAPGLPYAIGAQTAFPDRQVIAFVGDGAFTMLMGEMITAVKYHLPIKVVIIKNDLLGQIKWEQIVFLGNPQYVVDLEPADFAAWARAAGAHGFTCDDPKKLESVMTQFLAVDGPAVLEAVVDPNEPPMPAKIKPKQAAHFAEALLKGEPGGPRIALTLFRDKVDNL